MPGHPVTVVDYNFLFPREFTEEDFQQYCREWLVFMDAFTCDLRDLRAGTLIVTQAAGVGFQNVMGLKMQKRFAALVSDSFPIRPQRLFLTDAGRVMRWVVVFARMFLKKKLQERIVVCTRDELFEEYGFERSGLPALFDGTHPGSLHESIRARLERRAESIRRVQIPPP